MDSKSNDWCLNREGGRGLETERDREDTGKKALRRQRQRLKSWCHKSENARGCWESLEAKGGKEVLSPRAIQGVMASDNLILDFDNLILDFRLKL